MSGGVIFLQGFAEQRNAFVRDKHVFYRNTGAPATSQADGIPVVQERDLRYGNQREDAVQDSWMVDYSRVTPLLTKAIQDLDRIVKEQQVQIEARQPTNMTVKIG